jgi:hypothetical protein
VSRIWNLWVNVIMATAHSAMTNSAIIVDAMKMKTCAEYKPHIRIKHMTKVIIDEANRHMDRYRNTQRS